VSLLVQAPVEPLAAIAETIDAIGKRHGPAAVHGLPPGLLVRESVPTGYGWRPATGYTDGTHLPDLLEAATRRWHTAPHTAGALAWKAYAYWVALPAVLGYARVRRVPLVSAENMLVRTHEMAPFLEVGLVAPRLAVLAGDPLEAIGYPGVTVVPDEPALRRVLRRGLLDEHLAPVLEQLHVRARLGRRTLLGSVASGVAYALVRAAHALPGNITRTAAELLEELGVADLVEITPSLEVRRRTCCLAFNLPEPKICSGCCLRFS
jgi:Ferric iron reductase FhuF-like transporter